MPNGLHALDVCCSYPGHELIDQPDILRFCRTHNIVVEVRKLVTVLRARVFVCVCV